jgi:2-polyprenyl-3-methyl-5-hydroxy-6-metoxy-1,4-benzoquinol methylase
MQGAPRGPVPYCCPRCRGEVVRGGDLYACTACGCHYPLVCGIPDFRVAPDPYLGIEEDREKARRLADRSEGLDLAGLVRLYFEMTPEVPPALARGYAARALATGPARARSTLAPVEAALPQGRNAGRALEVGCGSGPFLPALAARFESVAATDVALRWLVVARRRLALEGCRAELACACAESLPFRDGSFEVEIAANVIEHLRDPRAMLGEALRLLTPGGLLVLTTPNRLSLAPDPHVRLPGLGFLPLRWRDPLARLLRGTRFQQVRTRSYFELRQLFSGAGFARVAFLLPELPALELARLSWPGRLAGRLYNRLRSWPVASSLLTLFGPFFQVLAAKAPAPERAPEGTAPPGGQKSLSQASPAPRA